MDKTEEFNEGKVTPLPQADALDDTYDPHDHRNLPHPTNNMETLVHLLKCSVGTGIVAMPQAFARAGLIVGAVCTILAGALITHSLRLLILSQYYVCKRQRVPLLTYPQSVLGALRRGPALLRRVARPVACSVDFFIIIYQLGVCCVYIVFIAESNKKVADPYKVMSVEMHILFILLPLLAFNMIPNLKILAPFSLVANLLMLGALGIIVYYLVTLPKLSDSDINMTGTIQDFPLFFGTVFFALTAVGVVVSLENNMKTPKSFVTPCGVLNTGMTIVVTVYVFIGIMGYYFCVDVCKDSITLNLPDSALSTAVQIMFMIAIFLSYGLNCYVPVEILWRDYLKPPLVQRGVRRLVAWEYGLRIVLCLFTIVVAAGVPRLGLFISLFGAMCLSAMGVAFPALMDMCCPWPNKPFIIFKDLIVFLIGVCSLVSGTYIALYNIVASFHSSPQKDEPPPSSD